MPPVFPQIYQFPIRRRRNSRTIVNSSRDGTIFKFADGDSATTEWKFDFQFLADNELRSLQAFFIACEGRLNGFTFLDPTDNLLSWSGKLDETVWEKDPLLIVRSDMPDPSGSNHAFQLINSGGIPMGLHQRVEVPAGFVSSFSVYVRSTNAQGVALERGNESFRATVTQNWRRLVFSGESIGNAEATTFGIVLDANSSIEVFGFQVEAQPAASPYRSTYQKCGVYQNTRFKSDDLTVTTNGPNQHSCTVELIHGDRF